MKRTVIAVLALSLCATLLTGCGLSMPIDSAGGGLDATLITFNDSQVEIKGGGAKFSGSTLTISASGSYRLNGELADGQVVVDTGDDAGLVTLILDNVSITNSKDAAIFVGQAKDVTIYLEKDTENNVTSGSEADEAGFDEATASGAAIYGNDDIDIDGEGVLNVFGHLNNGIGTKNDLDIKGGTVNVTAVNNGLRGSDSVEIKGGVLNVTAGNDGVKATEADKTGKGYVSITGGETNIIAAGDGVSAEKELLVSGGVINITCGTAGSAGSGKGMKAQTGLTVSGGVIEIISVDHALHSTVGIAVSGGALSLVSDEGKGIAAHDSIDISGGAIQIVSAKDGIDTETDINVSGGDISVISGEDGLNAKGTMKASGGKLLSVGISKRIKSFDSASTQGFFNCSINGAPGSAVTVQQGASVMWTASSRFGFNTVICTSPSVVIGETYTVSAGDKIIDITA